jgi:hypothetical protein
MKNWFFAATAVVLDKSSTFVLCCKMPEQEK